ncbi:hypothetical protein PENTCL1PPCAC_5045, partial [Pristionchus entomophagus]
TGGNGITPQRKVFYFLNKVPRENLPFAICIRSPSSTHLLVKDENVRGSALLINRSISSARMRMLQTVCHGSAVAGGLNCLLSPSSTLSRHLSGERVCTMESQNRRATLGRYALLISSCSSCSLHCDQLLVHSVFSTDRPLNKYRNVISAADDRVSCPAHILLYAPLPDRCGRRGFRSVSLLAAFTCVIVCSHCHRSVDLQ